MEKIKISKNLLNLYFAEKNELMNNLGFSNKIKVEENDWQYSIQYFTDKIVKDKITGEIKLYSFDVEKFEKSATRKTLFLEEFWKEITPKLSIKKDLLNKNLLEVFMKDFSCLKQDCYRYNRNEYLPHSIFEYFSSSSKETGRRYEDVFTHNFTFFSDYKTLLNNIKPILHFPLFHNELKSKIDFYELLNGKELLLENFADVVDFYAKKDNITDKKLLNKLNLKYDYFSSEEKNLYYFLPNIEIKINDKNRFLLKIFVEKFLTEENAIFQNKIVKEKLLRKNKSIEDFIAEWSEKILLVSEINKNTLKEYFHFCGTNFLFEFLRLFKKMFFNNTGLQFKKVKKDIYQNKTEVLKNIDYSMVYNLFKNEFLLNDFEDENITIKIRREITEDFIKKIEKEFKKFTRHNNVDYVGFYLLFKELFLFEDWFLNNARKQGMAIEANHFFSLHLLGFYIFQKKIKEQKENLAFLNSVLNEEEFDCYLLLSYFAFFSEVLNQLSLAEKQVFYKQNIKLLENPVFIKTILNLFNPNFEHKLLPFLNESKKNEGLDRKKKEIFFNKFNYFKGSDYEYNYKFINEFDRQKGFFLKNSFVLNKSCGFDIGFYNQVVSYGNNQQVYNGFGITVYDKKQINKLISSNLDTSIKNKTFIKYYFAFLFKEKVETLLNNKLLTLFSNENFLNEFSNLKKDADLEHLVSKYICYEDEINQSFIVYLNEDIEIALRTLSYFNVLLEEVYFEESKFLKKFLNIKNKYSEQAYFEKERRINLHKLNEDLSLLVKEYKKIEAVLSHLTKEDCYKLFSLYNCSSEKDKREMLYKNEFYSKVGFTGNFEYWGEKHNLGFKKFLNVESLEKAIGEINKQGLEFNPESKNIKKEFCLFIAKQIRYFNNLFDTMFKGAAKHYSYLDKMEELRKKYRVKNKPDLFLNMVKKHFIKDTLASKLLFDISSGVKDKKHCTDLYSDFIYFVFLNNLLIKNHNLREYLLDLTENFPNLKSQGILNLKIDLDQQGMVKINNEEWQKNKFDSYKVLNQKQETGVVLLTKNNNKIFSKNKLFNRKLNISFQLYEKIENYSRASHVEKNNFGLTLKQIKDFEKSKGNLAFSNKQNDYIYNLSNPMYVFLKYLPQIKMEKSHLLKETTSLGFSVKETEVLYKKLGQVYNNSFLFKLLTEKRTSITNDIYYTYKNFLIKNELDSSLSLGKKEENLDNAIKQIIYFFKEFSLYTYLEYLLETRSKRKTINFSKEDVLLLKYAISKTTIAYNTRGKLTAFLKDTTNINPTQKSTLSLFEDILLELKEKKVSKEIVGNYIGKIFKVTLSDVRDDLNIFRDFVDYFAEVLEGNELRKGDGLKRIKKISNYYHTIVKNLGDKKIFSKERVPFGLFLEKNPMTTEKQYFIDKENNILGFTPLTKWHVLLEGNKQGHCIYNIYYSSMEKSKYGAYFLKSFDPNFNIEQAIQKDGLNDFIEKSYTEYNDFVFSSSTLGFDFNPTSNKISYDQHRAKHNSTPTEEELNFGKHIVSEINKIFKEQQKES